MEDVKPGTPLPWKLKDKKVVGKKDVVCSNGRGGNVQKFLDAGDADMAYIVHACNNYAALEAKLERMEALRSSGPLEDGHLCASCQELVDAALTASTTENGG